MPNPPGYLSPPLLSRWLSRVVLYPSKHLIDPGGAERRDITVAGATLSMFVKRSPGCAGRGPAVFDLQFSGNGSRAEKFTWQAAEAWGDRPVEVCGLNYPGYGGSTGPASLGALVESGLMAFDAVAAVAGDRPVVLGCHSIGCAVGLHVAARRPAAGIVLLNPPPLRHLIHRHYGPRFLWLGPAVVASQIPPELDSLRNAAACRAPAMFFSGRSDRIVPPRFHRMVFDVYAGPKQMVELPDARHNSFPDSEDERTRAAMAWFWKRVNDTPADTGIGTHPV
jgi:pimeloyl-ACP methyl ester carboxylesterase